MLAVSFASPARIGDFVKSYPLPFPIVSDETRTAYAAFALGRTSAGAMMRPGIIGHFLGLIFHGWLPTLPDKHDDLMQLGGDFILDRDGKLRYAYGNKDALDHPKNAILLEAFRKVSEPEA